MSLLFQKIKCILCENTKPSAKLISFCHTTKKNLSYKPVFVRFLEDVKIDVKIAYSTWCAT